LISIGINRCCVNRTEEREKQEDDGEKHLRLFKMGWEVSLNTKSIVLDQPKYNDKESKKEFEENYS
jgi:hypothetical protein